MTVYITRFNRLSDTTPQEDKHHWADLAKLLTRFVRREVQDGELWSPCRYLPGATRSKDQVTDLWALVLDFDDGAAPEDLTPWWDKQGLEYVVHSTWHHQRPKNDKPACWRWRAVFPFSRPCTAAQWDDVFERTSYYLAGDLWDVACTDTSRMFFWPSATPGGEIYSDHHQGRKLDPNEAPPLPAKEPQVKTRTKTAAATDGKGKPGTDYCDRGDHERLLENNGWAKVGKRGDNELWRRPGKKKGHSATWHTQRRTFYPFTSSTCLTARTGYSLFGLLAEFEHSGDMSATAKKLYQDGYGDRMTKDRRPRDDDGPRETPPPEVVEDYSWDPPAQFHHVHARDFPLAALPSWLADYVSEVAEATQVPVDLPAMVSLSVLSAAARGRFNIEAPLGHSEPMTLYSLIALPPGERKSSVFSLLREPLDKWEADELEAVAPDIGEEQTRQAVLEKRLEHLKGKAAKINDPMERRNMLEEATSLAREVALFQPCCSPRLMADDVTPEELVHLLAEHQGRLALLSAEGGLFDIISGLYSDGRANIDGLLKAYDGESIRVDRRSRPPLHVPRAVLTLGLAIQPAVIQGLADNPKFRGRGLIGRFMFSIPEEMIGRRGNTCPILETSKRHYSKRITALINIPTGSTTVTLKCDPDALRAFQRYAATLEPRLSPTTGDLGTVSDWAGKLCGRLARIAGLVHLAEHGEGMVSRETLERVLDLGPYMIEHATKAFSLMGADPEIKNAEKVLDWIERNAARQFTKREAFNGLRGVFKTVDKLDIVLRLLDKHGYIRVLEKNRAKKRGRNSSPGYEVHPHLG